MCNYPLKKNKKPLGDKVGGQRKEPTPPNDSFQQKYKRTNPERKDQKLREKPKVAEKNLDSPAETQTASHT
jgi:hypothetical protein